MTNLLSSVSSVVLAGILVVECARAGRVYRRAKAEIAAGDRGARVRLYRQTVWFEVMTGALASLVLALRPPAETGLGGLPIVRRIEELVYADPSFWIGFSASFAVGSAIGVWVYGRRAGPSAAPGRLHRLLPDFDALIPETPRERLWFALVAVSAGVCEEIVFRGWLVGALAHLGLRGEPLMIVAAAAFGAAHLYQGPLGVLGTASLGAVLVGLYGATGSLVLPIVVHTAIDLRWALPSPAGLLRRFERRTSRGVP